MNDIEKLISKHSIEEIEHHLKVLRDLKLIDQQQFKTLYQNIMMQIKIDPATKKEPEKPTKYKVCYDDINISETESSE